MDVAIIPDPDLYKIRKYCESRLPAKYLDEWRIQFSVRSKSVTLFDARVPWSPMIGPEWTRVQHRRTIFLHLIRARRHRPIQCSWNNCYRFGWPIVLPHGLATVKNGYEYQADFGVNRVCPGNLPTVVGDRIRARM